MLWSTSPPARHVRSRILLAVASARPLTACMTHPDSLHLDMRGIELVAADKYMPGRARGELALAILFGGRAPFATIAAKDLHADFECELRHAADKAVSMNETGPAFFDGTAADVDPASGLALLTMVAPTAFVSIRTTGSGTSSLFRSAWPMASITRL